MKKFKNPIKKKYINATDVEETKVGDTDITVILTFKRLSE